MMIVDVPVRHPSKNVAGRVRKIMLRAFWRQRERFSGPRKTMDFLEWRERREVHELAGVEINDMLNGAWCGPVVRKLLIETLSSCGLVVRDGVVVQNTTSDSVDVLAGMSEWC